LRDADGDFVRSWDSDTDFFDGGDYRAEPHYEYPPNEMSGDILSIYNVYGTSADFVAPESVADVARFETVQSPEGLLAAVGGSSDSCASEVEIQDTSFTAFPGTGD